MLLERLLENLALEVEAFAMCRVAPGWRLRLPALERATFHFVLRGTGEVSGGTPRGRELAAGSLAVVPPGLIHRLQCGKAPYAEEGLKGGKEVEGELAEHRAGPQGDSELLVACGRVQVVFGGSVGVFNHLRDVLVVEFADEPKMGVIFETLLAEIRSPQPGSRAMVSALMNESLVLVFRRLCTESECHIAWLDALEDPHLERALEAMLDRPGDPHTVTTLAGLCYLSRSAFSRRFRESFGRPPMEYLRGIRLREAARLLRRDSRMPVATVAKRVGFVSRSQFSRAFKDYFQAPPTAFRI